MLTIHVVTQLLLVGVVNVQGTCTCSLVHIYKSMCVACEEVWSVRVRSEERERHTPGKIHGIA